MIEPKGKEKDPDIKKKERGVERQQVRLMIPMTLLTFL
jgi:hypothetical protein